MCLWMMSLLIGSVGSAAIVGVAFVLLIADGLGRLPSALGTLTRFILALGLRIGDDQPAITLAVSFALWTLIFTLTIALIWTARP